MIRIKSKPGDFKKTLRGLITRDPKATRRGNGAGARALKTQSLKSGGRRRAGMGGAR